MKEHARAKLGGRQHGYGPHPVKELCWLVLGMNPSHFSDWMDTWHSAAEQGEMIFRNGDIQRMILNRIRRGVPFCNALFIHQRQVCVDGTYLGLSCNSSSTLGEGE